MAKIDHIIVKVNDIEKSVEFFTNIMGFTNAGVTDPFTVIRVSEDFQIQLAPWGTKGFEHYAFAVNKQDFIDIFDRIKRANIDHGPSFHNVGTNDGPGKEIGAQGIAPTLYFNDPNNHLIEIRCYDF